MGTNSPRFVSLIKSAHKRAITCELVSRPNGRRRRRRRRASVLGSGKPLANRAASDATTRHGIVPISEGEVPQQRYRGMRFTCASVRTRILLLGLIVMETRTRRHSSARRAFRALRARKTRLLSSAFSGYIGIALVALSTCPSCVRTLLHSHQRQSSGPVLLPLSPSMYEGL